jgi:hypothetical protein
MGSVCASRDMRDANMCAPHGVHEGVTGDPSGDPVYAPGSCGAPICAPLGGRWQPSWRVPSGTHLRTTKTSAILIMEPVLYKGRICLHPLTFVLILGLQLLSRLVVGILGESLGPTPTCCLFYIKIEFINSIYRNVISLRCCLGYCGTQHTQKEGHEETSRDSS